MKDSSLKIVVLALLLVVFTAVVITARWADESDYDHMSCPTGEVSSQDYSPQHQTSSLNTRAEAGKAEPEATSAVSWTDLNGYNLDEIQQQDRPGRHAAKRPSEEPDDGGEPPDKSKYTYGNDNVE